METSNLILAYERRYSELEGLQHADCITYTLQNADGALYLEAGRTTLPPVRCPLHGTNTQAAARLLCFLYENAVAPEQIPGVVQDLCGVPTGSGCAGV